MESSCFENAELVSFTTEGQAEHYRRIYPHNADFIRVTPNMMPVQVGPQSRMESPTSAPEGLRVVYTGALYHDRDPTSLIEAVEMLLKHDVSAVQGLAFDFYGNMEPETAARLAAIPGCVVRGPVPFDVASAAQASADVLLTLEPDGDHPLSKHFLPSKNLDYIAQHKPILAVTPVGSETARLCESGAGWAVPPADRQRLMRMLAELLQRKRSGQWPVYQTPSWMIDKYKAENVAASIVSELRGLSGRARFRLGSGA